VSDAGAAGSIAARLLEASFPDGLPARLAALVDQALCDRLIDRYKLGVVLPFEGGGRPLRLTHSAEGERERWIERVSAAWPEATAFVRAAPEHLRLLIDSDGSERAELYLDDLPGSELGPRGLPVLCVTSWVPGPAQSVVTRHEQPWPELAAAARMAAAGADGCMWGTRWLGDAPRSLVWISEARRRGTLAASRAVAARLGRHERYDAVLASLAAAGREGYVDGIEHWDDGRIDVTLAVS
jgi:hypothetical protein